MNNSQKTVYLIAIIAFIILIGNGLYTSRIYSGITLEKNAMLSLNTENGHGVTIHRESNFVSFESGFVYNLTVTDFPDPEKETISVAIPVKRLKPNKVYNATLSFKMETNSPSAVTIESNDNLSMEQTSFNGDVNYKPVVINNGSQEYVVDITFETNEEGIGYLIFDFKIDDTIDTLKVKLSNVIIKDFKEINDDTVDTEQASETSIEII